jgi:hypothetical protein
MQCIGRKGVERKVGEVVCKSSAVKQANQPLAYTRVRQELCCVQREMIPEVFYAGGNLCLWVTLYQSVGVYSINLYSHTLKPLVLLHPETVVCPTIIQKTST